VQATSQSTNRAWTNTAKSLVNAASAGKDHSIRSGGESLDYATLTFYLYTWCGEYRAH
jgi:hypothetical protein